MYRTQASIQQEMSPVTSQIHAESVLSSLVDFAHMESYSGKDTRRTSNNKIQYLGQDVLT